MKIAFNNFDFPHFPGPMEIRFTLFYSKISLNEANGILSLSFITLLYANGNGLPTILL